MYSRGEVKPSSSTAVANRVPSDSDRLHIAQRCFMCRAMYKRGYLTHPLDDYVMGFSPAHLPATYQGMRFSPLGKTATLGLGVHGLDAFASPPSDYSSHTAHAHAQRTRTRLKQKHTHNHHRATQHRHSTYKQHTKNAHDSSTSTRTSQGYTAQAQPHRHSTRTRSRLKH